ncbi:MAG: hypothetical protein ACRDZW_06610, partial [Acidimicrobiales bacterium]
MRPPAAVVAVLVALAGACASSSPPRPGAVPPTTEPGPAAAAEFEAPVSLGVLDDDGLTESSGLAASRRNPDLLWTHNDSGDSARLYCLTRAAKRCGTWRVSGAEAVDWEDMAAGPGPVAGEHYLYAGDIGDNGRSRGSIVVYRVVEPIAPRPDGGEATTAPADVVRLRYEDGAHNAEALLV